MSSLLKYASALKDEGNLSFITANDHGMPYRGQPVALKRQEYEEILETVNDGFVELFDLDNADHKNKLREIVDRAANGWYNVLTMDHKFAPQPDGSMKVYVYCVWAVPYKEVDQKRLSV